ncbi:MAG: hypothetical protein B7C24_17660 [Bacteroidetes bacterium 4572_77]|nr:MAG: hypothetical protein B7C24_17660 [Bacteroidetes bacterium 4572_77]
MWARGNNSYGKLGIGNDTLRPPWTEVTGGPWESVHGVSSFNNAARDVNGYVYYTGYNRNVADYMHIGYIGDSRIFRREVDNKIWRHYDLADTTRLGVSEFLTHNTAPITNPEAGPSTFGGGHTLPGSGFTSASDLRGWLSLPLSGSNIVDVQGANASAFVGVGTPNEFYIYGNGLNAAGRLGLGFFGDGVGNPTARVWTWSQSLGGPWKNFSAGYTGTMAAIKSDGTLWTWGDNSYGTLGIGDFENRHTPTQVGNKNNWVKVSCGAGVMAALNAEGEIWSCGSNEHGHCGILDGGMFVNTLTRETTHGIWTDVYCKVTSGILALR